MTTEQQPASSTPNIGRNEPCPCGSGKKYKRCHGIDAAPKMSMPKLDWSKPAGAEAGEGATGAPGFPGGLPFDPSQIDPQWLMQFSQALQRLPRGQMQRLQAMMQKAMAGKDVSREAAEFERTLPPQFQSLLKGFQMPGMSGMDPAALAQAEQALPEVLEEASAQVQANMSEDQAKQIVAQAVAEGRLSPEEAQKLLGASAPGAVESAAEIDEEAASALTASDEPTDIDSTQTQSESQTEQKKGFGKLWKSIKGK